MAKIHFKKEGEPSLKKDYIPASVKFKEISEVNKKHKNRYKIALIVSSVVNLILIGCLIYALR